MMDPEREQERMHDALSAALNNDLDGGELDGGVLTKWCLVCEIRMPDGVARMMRFYGPDTTPEWDAQGLLHYALRTWGETGDEA